MRPVVVTVGSLAAANNASIAASQTPSGAGNLTLTSSTVTLDQPRQVLITTTSDTTARTFTVTGTTFNGAVVSETVKGPNNSTVATNTDFATVTSISISGSASAALYVGTNSVAGSSWVRFDEYAPSNVSIQCTVSGTVNYTIQSTLDDPNSATNPVSIPSVTWVNSSDTNVVSATATKQSNFLFAPLFARVLVNSGTGSVTATFVQDSNGPY